PVVGCEACHGPGGLHAQAGGTGPIGFAARPAGIFGAASIVRVSAQFATCTFCHELLDANDPANMPAAATHAPASSFTPTGDRFIITDTHFSKPTATSG